MRHGERSFGFLRRLGLAFRCGSLVGLAVFVLGLEVSAQIVSTNSDPCSSSGLPGGGMSSGDYGGLRSSTLFAEMGGIESTHFKNLKILNKPIAHYNEVARSKCVEGVVFLRITFFANGTVGNFRVVKGLPYGLSGNAIEAAKLIRFEPALKNGKPVTVAKTLSYNFTIY